uniref:Rps16 protein n=1 Tax=Emericella nidulans TaxID=162425 RepID=V9GZD4_EMEND|nr:hypothetical protein, 1.3K (rps16 5' region) - Emericella nidulans [Aspergillus nidulans]AAA33323.1 upstream ORF [Aspergillus nidulans]
MNMVCAATGKKPA